VIDFEGVYISKLLVTAGAPPRTRPRWI